MSFDDPDHLLCTCSHRALRESEAVEFYVPAGEGKWTKIVFARDCPLHGIEINPASVDAENVENS